jgi:hypothetical protein
LGIILDSKANPSSMRVSDIINQSIRKDTSLWLDILLVQVKVPFYVSISIRCRSKIIFWKFLLSFFNLLILPLFLSREMIILKSPPSIHCF